MTHTHPQLQRAATGRRPIHRLRPASHPAAREPVEILVRRAAAGNQHAWNALVARFERLLWSITRDNRLDEADAADVAQTTWLRLVEHLATLRDPANVGAWLATTARRESLQLLRRRARCTPIEDFPEPPAGSQPEVDDRLVTEERDAELWRAFSLLNDRDQALLRLLTTDPTPSYEEIGAALGMPVGSIGPTRARCLARLRGHLAQIAA